MTAGRELDALVAEKVMGLSGFAMREGFGGPHLSHRVSEAGSVPTVAGPYFDDGYRVVPHYSTDIAAAIDAAVKAGVFDRIVSVSRTPTGVWELAGACLCEDGPNLALLLCRAALKDSGV